MEEDVSQVPEFSEDEDKDAGKETGQSVGVIEQAVEEENEPVVRRKEIDWRAIETDYVSGHLTPRQLEDKYGVDAHLVSSRAYKYDWIVRRDRVSEKIDQQIVSRAISKSELWLTSQHERCLTFRSKILESLQHADVIVDPQTLDQLTKAEMRIDDMGRRALGLVNPQQLDITSGGQPLGAFGAALDTIKAMVASGKVRAVDIDVDRLACSSIVRDGGAIEVSPAPAPAEPAVAAEQQPTPIPPQAGGPAEGSIPSPQVSGAGAACPTV